MPDWSDIFTVFLLFWPAVATVSVVSFLVLAGLLFLFSGIVLIFCVFLYGAYAVLRDTGILEWLLQKLFSWKDTISERVSSNVKQSFILSGTERIPKQPALFLGHPHGLYAISWFIHIALGLTAWPEDIQRPVMAVHSIFFRIPILRELFLRHQCIEATEEAILDSLQKGQSVLLLAGGIEELQQTNSESIHLVLKKRRGYARIAKQANVPLIPLLTIGENELFPVSKSWIWKGLQSFLYKHCKIALPLPTWKSLWNWSSLLYMPFQQPIETFVLPPLENLSRMSTKDIRDTYIQTLSGFAEMKKIPIEITQ